MTSDDLERLETKLAFVEKAANELSDVVYRQQRDILALSDKLAALELRLEAAKSSEPPYTPEQERPPHY